MEANIEPRENRQSSNSIEQCIQDCIACYQECLSCIPHCLSQGGKHVEQMHITLMMECAQICQTSAALMQLQSEFAHEHCQLCAKVCEACADSCEKIDPNDSTMQKCVDMCRRCARSCQSMAH